jgi:YD repeat-containing protein
VAHASAAFATDTFEPNDTLGSATPISPGSPRISYLSTSSDVDYYKFTVFNSQQIHVVLDVPESVDYYFYLYDANGTLLTSASGFGVGIDEVLDYSLIAGAYYLAVRSSIGFSASSPYTLTLTAPLAGDVYEPNDTRGDAPDMTIGSTVRSYLFVAGSNRLASETQPESGTTTYITYDGAGNLTRKSDARGQDFTYTYDGNNRLTGVSVAPGNPHNISIAYNEFDSRTSVSNGFVTSAMTYDRWNRLRSRADVVARAPSPQTETFAVGYEYDGRDNAIEVAYPGGREVAYDYDRANRVTTVWDRTNARTYAESITYHPSGAPASVTKGNGVVETFTYDSRYRPNTIGIGTAGALLGLTYAYDGVGNVTGITDGRGPTYTQTFGYDALDRLTSVFGLGSNAFTYDVQGNRLSKAGPPVTYTYSPQTNRLISQTGGPLESAATFAYDGTGNLTGGAGFTYTYTPFNLVETPSLDAVAVALYRYDADNQRAVKVEGTRQTFFARGAGGQVLAEYGVVDGGPRRWDRDYIYLGDRLLASVRGAQPSQPPPTVAFVSASTPVGESSGVITVEVRLTTEEALTAPVTVPFSLAAGTATADVDYLDAPGQIGFQVGAVTGATTSLSVTIINDATKEYLFPETFEVVLEPAAGVLLGSPNRHTVTISEDDLWPQCPAAGNFDGNRGSDLAVYHRGTATWRIGNAAPIVFGEPGDSEVARDYDGDRITDLAVYRPATGEWHIRHSAIMGLPVFGVQLGTPGDIPVPADYTGDGVTDVAVYRPSTGTWHVRDQATVQFGDPGDVPVPADYDGNGTSDIAVYRPATGAWYIRNQPTVVHGGPGWVPVVADYDGDCRADIVVYRPSTGMWWYDGGLTTGPWGLPGDRPVPRDYDGDGRADIAVYRPATATWLVRYQFTVQHGEPGDVPAPRPPLGPRLVAGDYSGAGRTDLAVHQPVSSYWFVRGVLQVQFGESGDTAVPGDYDGDGIMDLAVYRPGTWVIRNQASLAVGAGSDLPVPGDYNGDGTTDVAMYRPSTGVWSIVGQPSAQYGDPGDVPVPADYNGDGVTDVAVYRPSTGMWYIKGQPAVQYGDPGDRPVPADYTGDGLADVAVYRAPTGMWYIRGQAGVQFGEITQGISDMPVPGDYNGDGALDIAVYRPPNGMWYVRGGAYVQHGDSTMVPVVRVGGRY